MVRTRPALALAAVVATLVAAACVGPARTDEPYRRKASSTVATVRSSLETADLLRSAGEQHHLPAAYVSVVLGEAEEDAGAAAATFGSIQSPSARSDAVRKQTLAAVRPAIDLLATMRTLVRRGQVARALQDGRRLDDVAATLDALARRLS